MVPRLLRSQGARGNLDLLQGVAGEAAHLEEAEEGTLPLGGGPDGRRGLAHRTPEPGVTRCAQAQAECPVRLFVQSVRSGKSET